MNAYHSYTVQGVMGVRMAGAHHRSTDKAIFLYEVKETLTNKCSRKKSVIMLMHSQIK